MVVDIDILINSNQVRLIDQIVVVMIQWKIVIVWLVEVWLVIPILLRPGDCKTWSGSIVVLSMTAAAKSWCRGGGGSRGGK